MQFLAVGSEQPSQTVTRVCASYGMESVAFVRDGMGESLGDKVAPAVSAASQSAL